MPILQALGVKRLTGRSAALAPLKTLSYSDLAMELRESGVRKSPLNSFLQMCFSACCTLFSPRPIYRISGTATLRKQLRC